MKECSKCHKMKELQHFYKNSYTKDGYMTYCKECQHLSNKPKRKTRMDEMRIMAGGKCNRCGYWKCLDALDFHHKDNSTKCFNIGSFKGSKSQLLKEISKSELLCANCHSKETSNLHRLILSEGKPEKICSSCNQMLPYSWYDKRNDTKDGYYPMCKNCRLNYQAERRHYNKKHLISLLGGCCEKCGEDDIRVLDFHHKNSTTKCFNIADRLDRRLGVLEKEALKCKLLCRNCHREEHCNTGNVV